MQNEKTKKKPGRIKRWAKRLVIAFALAVGIYHAADAAAPKPQLTQVFNNASALPQSKTAEYRMPGLAEPDPATAKDLWRVRVGAWHIGLGGHHTFLEFSPYSQNDAAAVNNKDVFQIHGIATDEKRHTWAQLYWLKSEAYTRYFGGDYILKGMGIQQDHQRNFFWQQPVAFVDVYYGSKEEVLKMYLDSMQVADRISSTNDDYVIFSHNSNSARRTYCEALGLPLTPLFVAHRAEALGGRIWAPGLETSLLPKDWDMKKMRAQSDYNNMNADQLEARARAVSGPERTFATFRTPAPPKAA